MHEKIFSFNCKYHDGISNASGREARPEGYYLR